MAKKLSAEVWEQRVNEAGAGRYEFVKWADYDKFGSKHKCVVRCAKDNYEWIAKVNSVVNCGHGCPQCAGKRRWTAEERIEQINELENIEFISFDGDYKTCCSRANVKCKVDNFVWSASVNKLVNCGYGCPKCAKYGYDKSKTGTIYALRSECGQYVKVGISNDPKSRHKRLEKRTPLKFNLVEQISGGGVKIAELEKHFHDKYERAGFTGFDGCTEWLISTPELLEELRNLGDK